MRIPNKRVKSEHHLLKKKKPLTFINKPLIRNGPKESQPSWYL